MRRALDGPGPGCAAELARWTFVDSGTSALIVALTDCLARAHVSGRAEVVVPAYCCPQVLSAVEFVGAKPRLVDFEPGTPWLDVGVLQAAVNPQTVAVIAINFLGIPERLATLRAALSAHTRLIYDCCQSFPHQGERLDGADYFVWSFGRGKPVTLLHGGALYCEAELSEEARRAVGPADEDSKLAHRARILAYDLARLSLVYPMLVHAGLADRTRYEPARPPRQMQERAVALLAPNIAAYRARGRSRAQERIRAALAGARRLTDLTAACGDGGSPRLLRYPVLCADQAARNELLAVLRRRHIGASALYGRTLPALAGDVTGEADGSFPHARAFADTLLTLPVHSGVGEREIQTIESTLTRFARRPS